MILCKHDINWYIHRTIELCTWFHRCMKKIEKKFHASNVLEKTLRKTYYDSSLRVHVSDLVLLFSAWVKRHGTLQVSGPAGIWEAQPACEQFYLHVNRPACMWVGFAWMWVPYLQGIGPACMWMVRPVCECSWLDVSALPTWEWPCLHGSIHVRISLVLSACEWSYMHASALLLGCGFVCLDVSSSVFM